MNSRVTAKVPIGVWIAAICGVSTFLVFAFWLQVSSFNTSQREKEKLPPFNFGIERLHDIGDNGIVVMGTSLTQYGFPFDEDFALLAERKGISLRFVRFSRGGLEGQEYQTLMPEILKYHPRFVFVQAEPFFLELARSDKRPIIRRAIESIHFHLHFLFGKILATMKGFLSNSEIHLKKEPPKLDSQKQGDQGLKLDDIAHLETINDGVDSFFIRPPSFPPYIESFLRNAKQLGITVVLLEMNRSQAGNDYFGQAFRAELTEALKTVSQRYQIPYWQFRGDLPLDHYSDRAHLNRRGRTVFTDWFLEKFVQEYGNDRL